MPFPVTGFGKEIIMATLREAKIGQTVRVKIIKIDDEQQRVSLSIRAILEEAEQAEDSADESAEVSEDAAADAE